MIRHSYTVLLLLCLRLDALGASRLKGVSINFNNETNSEWKLASPVIVGPGSIDESSSQYRAISPQSQVFLAASGTGKKTGNPHFVAQFNYISGSKKHIHFKVVAEGSTDIGISDVTAVGARVNVSQSFTFCDERCTKKKVAGVCPGLTYHTCQILVTFLNPPIRTTTVSFRGNFTPQQSANYANEMVRNLNQEVRSCLIQDNPVSYHHELPSQLMLSVKTQC